MIHGTGIPILFEAGAGDEISVGDSIMPRLQKITGAPLIAYERAGFGRSTINVKDTALARHGIESNVDDLEKMLELLGYNHELMVITHS